MPGVQINSYTWPDGETKKWTGLDVCVCYDCREMFNSEYPFTKHRQNRQDGKCPNPADLGMVKNKRGYWVTALKPEGIKHVKDGGAVFQHLDEAETPPAQNRESVRFGDEG